ncbi:MAG: hypothetical protein Q7J32_04445 [Sphingomonadaceae bacterium]|nr:hypothetical protein [Sphingomonadaceae bacterium]
MANGVRTTVPTWYWVVAGLALLWSLAGCYAYVSQMTISPAEFARLPQAQQDIWNAQPSWVSGAYALAVWTGLGGAAGLLFRKAWARPFYILSLLSVIVQFGWVFTSTEIMTTVGPSSAIFPACIAALALFLVWFSGLAIKRGWLS